MYNFYFHVKKNPISVYTHKAITTKIIHKIHAWYKILRWYSTRGS